MVPLDEEPNYKAISYSWGGSQGVHPVFIDGEELPITENLCGALRHMRSPSSPQWICVDALCISQRDLNERAQQVVLMRRIFRQAKQVCVWLGHGCKPVEHVLQFKEFAKEAQSDSRGYLQPNAIFRDDDQCREGLEKFCRVDFWSRLWVIQEVVLAHTLVVCYGWVRVHSNLMTESFMEAWAPKGTPAEYFFNALGPLGTL